MIQSVPGGSVVRTSCEMCPGGGAPVQNERDVRNDRAEEKMPAFAARRREGRLMAVKKRPWERCFFVSISEREKSCVFPVEKLPPAATIYGL